MTPDLFETFPVPEQLKRYVRRFLFAPARGVVDATVPVRPSGYIYFGWVASGRWQGFQNGSQIYDSEVDGTVAFAGQITQPNVSLRMSGDFSLLNAELTPTGFYELTGQDASTLNDRTVSLSGLGLSWGPLTSDGRDQIKCAIETLERGAKRALMAPKGVAKAAATIEAQRGDLNIASLANDCGVSERTLRRNFKKCLGISAKRFANCVQVNSVLAELFAKSPNDLAELAHKAGFADQSHMTKSFIGFLGQSPGHLRAGLEPTLAIFVAQSQSQNALNN